MSSNIKNLDWLALLQGDSPLLERSKLEYIAEVRRRIMEEVTTRPGFPCNQQHLKEKLCVMQYNFVKVVNYLKENSVSKNYFLCTYPEWQVVRRLSILQLKEIAKTVNTDSQNCSISRGVGSSVSLIGGLICLAAGNGTSRILGSVMMGLGSITSAGTSSVELSLLRKKIKEAEIVIQEDKEFSEKLWNWISDISYIQEALNIIRNIDVDMNLKKAANEFHIYYKKKSKLGDLKVNVTKLMKYFDIAPGIIAEVSDVVGILLATSMLYDRYRPCFNVALETYKCNKILSTACDVIVATARMTSAINVSKNSELTTLQKSKIATGMALDAISIILACEGANSTSREAKAIVKAAEKLEEEAEIFKELYLAVKDY